MWRAAAISSGGLHLAIVLSFLYTAQARLMNTTCGLVYINLPGTLRPGVVEKGVLVKQRSSLSIDVTGSLTFRDSTGQSRQLSISKRLAGGFLGSFSLPVIPVGTPPGQATLLISMRTVIKGRLCRAALAYSRPIIASRRILLVETDKSLYRPGQSVFIRIVRLGEDLLPADGQVSTVVVQGTLPSGVTVTGQTWHDVNLENGVAKLEFKLPNSLCDLGAQDLPGMWTVRVKSKGGCSSHSFNVSSFALPNFRVELSGPRYLTYSNSRGGPVNVDIGITARYSNGLPVEGFANVDFEMLESPRFWFAEPRPRVFQAPIKGMTTVTASLPELDGLKDALVVTARVIESATNMEQVALPIVIPFARHDYVVKIVPHVGPPLSPTEGDIFPRVGTVHPLLPFYFTVHVTHPDGSPATARVTFQASSTPYYKPPEWRWTSEIQGSRRMRFGLLGADEQLQIEATIENCCFGEVRDLVVLDVLTPAHAMFDHTLHVNSLTGKGEVGKETQIEVCADITNGMPSQLFFLVKNLGQTVYEHVFDSTVLEDVDLGTFAPGAAALPFPAQCRIVNIPVSTNFGMNPTIHVAAHGSSTPGHVMQGSTTIVVDGLTDDRLKLSFSGQKFAKPRESRNLVIAGRPGDVVHYTVVDARVSSLAKSERTYVSSEKVAMTLSDATRSVCPKVLRPTIQGTWCEPSRESDLLIRSFFPETWLWGKVVLNTSGMATVAVNLPDSITSWSARAFAINPSHRIAIAKPVSLAVNQPFYVRLDMADKIIKGELTQVRLTVFNSGNQTGCFRLSANVTVANLGLGDRKTMCKCQFSTTSVPLSFQAPSSENNIDVCGYLSVAEVDSCDKGTSGPSFSDRVCRTTSLEPVGQVERSSCIKIMAHNSTKSGAFIEKVADFTSTRNLMILLRVTMHVAGDIMALVAEKLPEALSLPVTADRAVKNIILAGHVLQFTKQLPPVDSQKRWADQAESLLQQGKLNLLQFKDTQRSAGALKALRSPHPSTWLTIHAAHALLGGFFEGYETFICDALKWIFSQQSATGYVQSLSAQGKHGNNPLYDTETTSLFAILLHRLQSSKLQCPGLTASNVHDHLKRAEIWIKQRFSIINSPPSCYELSLRALIPGRTQRQRVADYTNKCSVHLGSCSSCFSGKCPTASSLKIGQQANAIIASLAIGKDLAEQQTIFEQTMTCALHHLNTLELPDYNSFLQAVAAVSAAVQRQRQSSSQSVAWLLAQIVPANSQNKINTRVNLPTGAARRAFISNHQLPLPERITLITQKTSKFVVMFSKEHVLARPIQRKIFLSSTISSRSPGACQHFQMEICLRWTGKDDKIHGVTLDVDLPSGYVTTTNPISGLREAFVGQYFLQQQGRHVRIYLRKVLGQTRCLQISAMAYEFASRILQPVVSAFYHTQPCFRSTIPVNFNQRQCSGSSTTAGPKGKDKGCPVCGYMTYTSNVQESVCSPNYQALKLRIHLCSKSTNNSWNATLVAIYHTGDQPQIGFQPNDSLVLQLAEESQACWCPKLIFRLNADFFINVPPSTLDNTTRTITIDSESKLSAWTSNLQKRLSSIACQSDNYCKASKPFCPLKQ